MGGLRDVLFGRRALPVAAVLAGTGALFGLYQLGARHVAERSTLAAVVEMQRAARAFVIDMDRCPRSPTELLHPPRSGVHYLERLPQDAWGQELYLDCSLDGKPVVTVTSPGPSGSLLVDDNLP